LAKIAAEVERALFDRDRDGSPGRTDARLLVSRAEWTVQDVVCSCRQDDRPFEEQHGTVDIAIVVAGTFQYRAGSSCELMTPGALLLGNAGQTFECQHDRGAGDRCVSFRYQPEYFDSLLDTEARRLRGGRFAHVRVPPLRELAPLVARASRDLVKGIADSWEEISIRLAALTAELVTGASPTRAVPSRSEAIVARTVRAIDCRPHDGLSLTTLAHEAGLSASHFLRVFDQVTGLTPHQYVMRARLRTAAVRLTLEPHRILDIALDCGFGDVSNFNRAFRREFGLSPSAYRKSRDTLRGTE
jgi:AraC family transcriptional regulator